MACPVLLTTLNDPDHVDICDTPFMMLRWWYRAVHERIARYPRRAGDSLQPEARCSVTALTERYSPLRHRRVDRLFRSRDNEVLLVRLDQPAVYDGEYALSIGNISKLIRT